MTDTIEPARTSKVRRGGWLLLILGVGLGFVLRGLLPLGGPGADASQEPEEAGGVEPADMQARVEVARAVRGSLPLVSVGLGQVRPDPLALRALGSRAGGRVLELFASPGQRVTAGERLLRFDPLPLQSALGLARAGLVSADAALDDFLHGGRAREEAARASAARATASARELADERVAALVPLHDDGVVPDRSLLEARAEARRLADEQQLAEGSLAAWIELLATLREQELGATREAAASTLGEAEAVLADADVLAPADGQILELTVSAGDRVEPGAAVGTLLGEGSSVIAFGLTPGALEGLALGSEAFFVDDRGAARHGHIVSLPVRVDSTTGLATLLVAPDDDGPSPRPGTVLRGELVRSRLDDVLLVPEPAVVRGLDQPTVVVVDDDGLAHGVPVQVLARHAGQVALAGGLDAGQRVIVAGGYNLPEGAHVLADEPAGGGR